MDIKTYRKNGELTQEAFAKLAGVDRTTINRLEDGGRASGETMQKIVKATDGLVSFEDLIKGVKGK